MIELNREDEKMLYNMLIKAFYGYKLHLTNEETPRPEMFEEMAYRNYHMLPTDYTKVEFNYLRPTIDGIVGQILNLKKESNKV
tara:strand:+ start:273 stop:521 length:249 start_codon:yes stop_codon:yes gene_type:complete